MECRIAICLTSHNRIDCTRINEEVFKLNFQHPYTVVHASSGQRAAPYLEDAFVRNEPLPHFAGAIVNMQTAVRAALEFNPDVLVLLDGDTWLLDERVLLDMIRRLLDGPNLLMAASSWMPPPRSSLGRIALELRELVQIREDFGLRLRAGLRRLSYDVCDFSTQFCILRNVKSLVDRFLSMRPGDGRLVERQWFDRFSARFDLQSVLRMTEREPVHPDHRFVCEPLALFSQHWPASGTSADPRDETDFHFVKPNTPGKREVLERFPNIGKGESIQRLLSATTAADLEYYNAGAPRY